MSKHQSTTVTTEPDRSRRVDGAKEFFGDGPPKDPATLSAATAAIEPAGHSRGTVEAHPGVFNTPKQDNRDKCGGNLGRCFGAVQDGVCMVCGVDYRAKSPVAGINLPAHAFAR